MSAEELERARVTVPFLAQLLAALAIFGTIGPVARDLLNQNASVLSTGELNIFALIWPLMALVVLGVIYRKAVGA